MSDVRLLDTKREGLTLYRGDALEVLASLPAASVDLVLTDPPYFRVKDEPWDRQWDTAEGFLAWIGALCGGWRRVLRPNGSLYVFASPEMAARVECRVRECFNVLNRIRWVKDAGWHQKTDEEQLRGFLSPWEEVIFAEQWGCEYQDAAQALHKQVFAPLGRYIQQERERAGLTRSEVEVALGFVSGNDPERGTALCYRWEEGSSLPTAATYDRLRNLLNRHGGKLEREYEDLRREYEDLRRPFNATPDTPHTDVWDFPAVTPYPGKHPCEKPLTLLRHIVQVSSRPGAVVLDCCMGSGSTGEAALSLGRSFVGCDASEHWAQYALARLERRFGALPQGNGSGKAPRRIASPQTALDLPPPLARETQP
jgi:adenine-specific DNA-methyltransferase